MVDHYYKYHEVASLIATACVSSKWEMVKAVFARYPRLSNTSTLGWVVRYLLAANEIATETKHDMVTKLSVIWPYLETDQARTALLSELLRGGRVYLVNWLLAMHNGVIPNPPRTYATYHRSFLIDACQGPCLTLARLIWDDALDKEALYPAEAYIVARSNGRMQIAEWLMNDYPIDLSFQIVEQLRGACSSGSIEMIHRLTELCPDMITPKVAQKMFASACFGNQREIAEYLLNQYDTIVIEKDDHRIFSTMTYDQQSKRWPHTLKLIMNLSAKQEYRYLKHGKNYYLVNAHWTDDRVKSTHLINGVYVCSTSVVSLEQATDCLLATEFGNPIRSIGA